MTMKFRSVERSTGQKQTKQNKTTERTVTTLNGYKENDQKSEDQEQTRKTGYKDQETQSKHMNDKCPNQGTAAQDYNRRGKKTEIK